MKANAIVQARMGSTRLPGKVLMPLADRPILDWVLTRLSRSELLSTIVVATTTEPMDDAIVEYCNSRGYPVVRGSNADVLDRYYQTWQCYPSDIVVRVTADCPLIDSEIVDQTLRSFYLLRDVDYVSNVLEPRTFPRGLDVEAFTSEALEVAWRSDESAWREHVTPFLYRNPDRFRLHGIRNEPDYSAYRWTVDTSEDLSALRALVEQAPGVNRSWRDYIAAIEANPAIAEINRSVLQKQT